MKKSIALLFTLLLPCVALASGGGEEENAAPKVAYYSLVPALVGNFGAGPKLKFYKADIALRVTGTEAEEKVEHHEPDAGLPQALHGPVYVAGVAPEPV